MCGVHSCQVFLVANHKLGKPRQVIVTVRAFLSYDSHKEPQTASWTGAVDPQAGTQCNVTLGAQPIIKVFAKPWTEPRVPPPESREELFAFAQGEQRKPIGRILVSISYEDLLKLERIVLAGDVNATLTATNKP